MDKPTARRPYVVAGEEVLDGTDPHAAMTPTGRVDEPAAPVVSPEPSPLQFWKGLLLGLILSTAMWCVLAAVAFVLYKTLID